MKSAISTRKIVLTAVALFAALGGFSPSLEKPLMQGIVSSAWADEAGGQSTGQGHQGGQGQGSKGAQSGQSASSNHGTGQGVPEPDSDGQGPQKRGLKVIFLLGLLRQPH